MAKIIAEVTKKLKGSWSDKDEKENEFFDWVTKWNPKTYDGKEDVVLLKEWITQMKNIFDVVEFLTMDVCLLWFLSYWAGWHLLENG